MHKALKELNAIIQLNDWSNFYPEKRRKEALDAWTAKWLVPVEFSQSVVSKDYLTADYQDLIKFKLAESLSQDLAESCITFDTEEQKVSASIVALRRANVPPKK